VPGWESPHADSSSAAVADSAAAAASRRRRRDRAAIGVPAGGAPAGRLAAETRADGRATAASFTGTGSHALLWTTATGQTPAATAGCGSPSTSESTVRAQSSSGTSRSGCPGLPGRGTEIVPIEPFHTERG